MAISLPDVSAKLVADVNGFINDFNRAGNAVRRQSVYIDKELDGLTKKIKNKFTLGDIGKDILKGFGVGSGFAAAQMAAEKITDYFREQAEHAKTIEESTAKQLEYTRKIISLRQTPEQQEKTLRKEFERAGRDLQNAKNVDRTTSTLTPDFRIRMGTRDYTNEELQKIEQLTEEYKRLGAEIEEVNKKARDAAQEDRTKGIATSVEAYKKSLIDEFNRNKANNKQLDERAEALDKEMEAYRDMANPLREYQQKLDRINQLEADGKLNAEEALAIRKAIAEKQFAGAPNTSGVSTEVDDLTDLAKYADEAAEAAKKMGEAFGDAFENAIFNGGKLSDVLDGLFQDILRLIIRQSVTTPIANALGGVFTGLFKAEGGPVQSGRSYIVGEEGPEVFKPNTGGTIIPNNALSSAGVGGNVYQIDARGTDETVVRRLEQALFALAGPGVVERRSLAAHATTLRRGGGAARAIGG